MTEIVFLGGGGHARACRDVAESAGLRVLGHLAPDGPGATPGFPRLGDDSAIPDLAAAGVAFVVATGHTGDPALRMALWRLATGRSARVVSPRATVSSDARVGDGAVILHHAHVGPGACVGCNAIVNTAAVVEHDAVVGDHAHVATRAVVNGGCVVGDGALVGSGAVLLQGTRIGPGTVVGAGAVVVRDLDGGVWAGVPARRIA